MLGTQPGIVDSEGFNLAYVGAAPDNGSAMHITQRRGRGVHSDFSGQWAIYWNEGDDMEEVVLGPMDCISVPAKVMRSFKNVGDTYGHTLLVIIGGTEEHDRLAPAQAVIDAAAAAGLDAGCQDGKMVAGCGIGFLACWSGAMAASSRRSGTLRT